MVNQSENEQDARIHTFMLRFYRYKMERRMAKKSGVKNVSEDSGVKYQEKIIRKLYDEIGMKSFEEIRDRYHHLIKKWS